MLYKQLFVLWWTTRSLSVDFHPHTLHKMRMTNSKCRLIETSAVWNVTNKQIHKDSEVPFFANHVREPTESFNSHRVRVTSYFDNSKGNCVDLRLTNSPEVLIGTSEVSRLVEVARMNASRPTLMECVQNIFSTTTLTSCNFSQF